MGFLHTNKIFYCCYHFMETQLGAEDNISRLEYSIKIVEFKKKLRDVLQERKGTSLNYFEVYYIEQFSRSILLYLIYSRSLLDYLGQSWCISVHLSVSQFISFYLSLSLSIYIYLYLSLSISVYLGLSWSILVYLGLSQTILDYLGLS